jgi:cellulose synthase/poly-beta-1,6-N-acetylglucosamine synthase-like glycosyltransferase
MQVVFWVLVFIIFYTYIGYGILLYGMVRIKRLSKKARLPENKAVYEPPVCLFVPAYNEEEFVDQKVQNCRELDYPENKITFLWVTDGSNDKTLEKLQKYPEINIMHQDARNGKIAAMNRGMREIQQPIVIFTDANTLLPPQAIREVVKRFEDPNTGCVSGEKRIFSSTKDAAAAAGEGLYWKYESTLKKWDDELYSAVGAAGELFAIRTELYQEVEADTLLDDFIISLRICMKGYKIAYTPEAYAIETSSTSVKEELKRKIRISAGGIQSVIRLSPLLNIFKYGILSFQYISHRVLRWTITPLCLLFVLVVNVFLINHPQHSMLYTILFSGQILFYLLALTGWLFEYRKIKLKVFFVPYYFFIMNLSTYLGAIRLIRKTQSVNWERAQRSKKQD